MALKNWKKRKAEEFWNTDIWVNTKEGIGINEINKLVVKPYGEKYFVFGDNYNTIGIELYSSSSKSQALAYAKKYMRTH